MATSRVRRGRKTEEIVAIYMREHGWPSAEPQRPNVPGIDVLGVPGIAMEVKARRGLKLTVWLSQTIRRPGLPVLVVRPDRSGPATVPLWPAVLPLGVLVDLLHEAGYGDAGGQ